MTAAKIIIVEDEHDIRVTLRMALELEGYEVTSAANGQAALDLLRKGEYKPDLIILDLMMPILNGWQVLEQLKADPKLRQIPVLVTSAAGNKSKVEDIIGFIPKPIDLDRALSLIAKNQSIRDARKRMLSDLQ